MYRIVITRTETVEKMQGRDWVKGGPEQNSGEYGYSPLIAKSTEVKTDVYSQSVSNLDLPTLIKAVNGIE